MGTKGLISMHFGSSWNVIVSNLKWKKFYANYGSSLHHENLLLNFGYVYQFVQVVVYKLLENLKLAKLVIVHAIHGVCWGQFFFYAIWISLIQNFQSVGNAFGPYVYSTKLHFKEFVIFISNYNFERSMSWLWLWKLVDVCVCNPRSKFLHWNLWLPWVLVLQRTLFPFFQYKKYNHMNPDMFPWPQQV